jgi:hypothetical protein
MPGISDVEGSAKQMLLWARLPDDHGKRGWVAILGERTGRSRGVDLAEGDQNLSGLQLTFKRSFPVVSPTSVGW